MTKSDSHPDMEDIEAYKEADIGSEIDMVAAEKAAGQPQMAVESGSMAATQFHTSDRTLRRRCFESDTQGRFLP